MQDTGDNRNIIPVVPEDLTDGSINAFLTSPTENASGELVGKWHAFPTTESDLRETLREIGIDAIGGQVIAACYDTGLDGLAQLLPENANLNELNYLAAKIDGMTDDVFERFEEALAYGDHTGSVKDLINLTDNLGCYTFILGARDDEALGLYMEDQMGITVDTDFVSLGEETRIAQNGIFCGGNYLYSNANAFIEHYNGMNLPVEYRVFDDGDRQAKVQQIDAPFEAYITNLGKYNEGELVGKWHPFPTTTEDIQQTFKEIGIDGMRYEEFFITDYDTDIIGIHEALPEYANLDELNFLATRLTELEDYELEAYQSIMETEGGFNSVQDLINLTYNLDSYDVIPGVEDDEDLGYSMVEESGCYDLKAMGNLANYIDYERFGRDIRLDEGGSFSSVGYVRSNGDSFTEHYDGIEVPEEYRVTAYPEKESPNVDVPGKMNVLLVEPGKVPRQMQIDPGLDPLQQSVGGMIEAVYPFDDPVALICNESGKIEGLPLNRALHDEKGDVYDIMAGSFLVVGLTDDNFGSLPPTLMEKFEERFKHPEEFVKLGGKILAVKVPVDEPGKSAPEIER